MTRAAPLVLLASTALLLGACAGSGAEDEETVGAGEPTAVRTDSSSTLAPQPAPSSDGSSQPAPSEPQPGTTVAPAAEAVPSDLDVGAPADWNVWQVDRVVFALPGDFEPSTDRRIPSASTSFFSPLNADGETVAGAAVFIETGAVGPLEIRTDLLEQVRSSQFGAEPTRGPEPVEVPGALGATRVDYAYDLTVAETGRVAPSLQVDVTIQVPDPGPQYSAFLNATTEEVDEADLDTFVDSFRVLDEQGQVVG